MRPQRGQMHVAMVEVTPVYEESISGPVRISLVSETVR